VPMVWSVTAPPALADEDVCDESPCDNACKDKCDTDEDCPKGNPVCKLLQCKARRCRSCLQKRCTKASSSSGGGGPG
jgi:hypothetical protein